MYTVVHDKEAPTKVGAMQTPSFVRIRWIDWLTGSTQAASCVSSVVNPRGSVVRFQTVGSLAKIWFVKGYTPGWMVSKIFFFGLSCERGWAPAERVVSNAVSHVERMNQVDYKCGEARTFILFALEVHPLAGFRAWWRLNEFNPSFLTGWRCCL